MATTYTFITVKNDLLRDTVNMDVQINDLPSELVEKIKDAVRGVIDPPSDE